MAAIPFFLYSTGSAPSTTSGGARSLLAFWIGGASDSSTAVPPHRVVGLPGKKTRAELYGEIERRKKNRFGRKWWDEFLAAEAAALARADETSSKPLQRALERAVDVAGEAVEAASEDQPSQAAAELTALLRAAASATTFRKAITEANAAIAMAEAIMAQLAEFEDEEEAIMLLLN
jgi:hypothetical protein